MRIGRCGHHSGEWLARSVACEAMSDTGASRLDANFGDEVDSLDLHAILLGAFLIFIAGVMLCIIREQRRNPLFHSMDLVTGDNGRIASTKFFAAGAFIGTSYAFLDGVVTGHDNTSMILAFSGVWAGASLINKTINNTTTAPTPPTTVEGKSDGS